ncbi:lipid A export permease/ATP-binding protein MsbA [Immundisolibacter sp.]|uniref:lipid A export permease/ATP-binding protein MsbA n=1 Tax=Immundisolibacter sp. TaxID=1934948 RepID=UPI002B0ED841|nr:lipid A export permease/ATP-binding protein MsbA [Immundisolibacter sp.]MEA3219090.1 Lipid A export ATP-binding/permease protein MsbA [Immundisolibacter sp.]
MTDAVDSAARWQIYARLLGYARPHWRVFALALIGMIGGAATDPAFAALMKPMLDGSFVERDPQTIRWLPVVMVGLFVVRLVCSFISDFGMNWVARRVIKDLRTAMFDHLLRLPASFYDRQASGALISKVTYDVEMVAGATSDALTTLLKDSVAVLGLLGWMFFLNWKLALIFLVVGPGMAASISAVSKRFRRLSTHIQSSMGSITAAAGEVVEGHLVTKLFNGQDRESASFDRLSERNRHLHMKWVSVDALGNGVVQLLIALTMAGILYAATTFASTERTTVGGFTSFIVAVTMLQAPVKRLTKVNGVLQKGITAARSVFGLIDELAEPDTGRRELVRARGEVEYQDVVFSYATSPAPVLRGVSLHAKPGQRVALVGRSGSGKTSLVGLLPRFYEPQAGRILIDGIDIRELTLASLRAQISLVSQHVVLFNDTVGNNIAYGRRGEVSEADIVRAAEQAHAMEFIRQLPQGLDSLVGDNGVLLSGGQRQRIAIARALLKDAPILILDEATSALDSESERHIKAALDALMSHRTTLVIAHRLSTIENADLILVMQDGRIVERGDHASLLRQGGAYARLHRMQFTDVPVAV